jgi:apolipoprotein N-acyltransferase
LTTDSPGDRAAAPVSTPGAPRWRGALVRLGLTALSAALLIASNPKASLWPLALVGFVPALLVLRGRSGLAAFGWGWLLGLLCNFGGQLWGVEVLQRFGKLPVAKAALVLAVVAAYQGLVLGIWAWGTRVVTARTRLPLPFVAAAALVVGELLIPFMMPWTWALLLTPFWPATQTAELFGTWSVSFLLMLVNAAVFVVLEARLESRPLPRRLLLATAAVVVVALGYGLGRGWHLERVAARSPTLRVGLVQPNFGIATRAVRARRWPEMVDTLRRMSAQAQREGAELVVWPESGWPLPVDRSLGGDYPEGHPWQLRRGISRPLLAGILSADFSSERQPMHNSAWLLGADGKALGRYDKVFLMPFGEYVPLGAAHPEWRRSVRKAMTESDELNRGERPVVLTVGAARIAPLICYEDILAGHVRSYARLRPNLLVTLSNLAWFGDSAEPEQQLGLASLRAVELRHELLRATTTGVSARIDALGRVRARTRVVDPPAGSLGAPPTVLTVDARLVDRGRTLFAVIGDLFAYLCAAFLLFGLAVAVLRRPRRLARGAEEA